MGKNAGQIIVLTKVAPHGNQIAVRIDGKARSALIAEGKGIDSLAWSETVSVDGGQEFRFMKAIPTGGVCLVCHGTELSPEVSQVLADLYPMDQATGYSEGDIRGAFVVTRQMLSQ